MNTFKNKSIYLKSLFLKLYIVVFLGCFSEVFATDQRIDFVDVPDDISKSLKNLSIQTSTLEEKIAISQAAYQQGQCYQALNNVDAACHYYEEAITYDHDHADALCELGRLKGPTGLCYTERAADLNHKIALYHLALIKKSLKNAKSAEALLIRSSELGYAPAQHSIGMLYLANYRNLLIDKPDDMTDDYSEKLANVRYQVITWLMKAALQSHKEADIECEKFLKEIKIAPDVYMAWYANFEKNQDSVTYFNLGVKYLVLLLDNSLTIDVRQSFKTQAKESFKKAADENHFGAQLELVCIYDQEQRNAQSVEGCHINPMLIQDQQYLKYLIKLASQDVKVAQKTHGNARGIVLMSAKKLADHYCANKDDQRSMLWLYRAIEFKDAESFFNLGFYMQKASNIELARSFYDEAKKLGYPGAEEKLHELSPELNKNVKIFF